MQASSVVVYEFDTPIVSATVASDTLVLGGTDCTDHLAASALTAGSLAAVSLLAGPSGITDTLEVRAFNSAY